MNRKGPASKTWNAILFLALWFTSLNDFKRLLHISSSLGPHLYSRRRGLPTFSLTFYESESGQGMRESISSYEFNNAATMKQLVCSSKNSWTSKRDRPEFRCLLSQVPAVWVMFGFHLLISPHLKVKWITQPRKSLLRRVGAEYMVSLWRKTGIKRALLLHFLLLQFL